MSAGEIWLRTENYVGHFDAAAAFVDDRVIPFPELGGVSQTPYGQIAADGTSLWIDAASGLHVYRLDPATLTVLDTFDYTNDGEDWYGGVAYDSGNPRTVLNSDSADLGLLEVDVAGVVLDSQVRYDLGNKDVRSISVAPGGGLVHLYASAGFLGRYDVDADTYDEVNPVPAPDGHPLAVPLAFAAKADGGFWASWVSGSEQAVFTEHNDVGGLVQTVGPPYASPLWHTATTAIDVDVNDNLVAWLNVYDDDSTGPSRIIRLAVGTGALTVLNAAVPDPYGFTDFGFSAQSALHVERSFEEPPPPPPPVSVAVPLLGGAVEGCLLGCCTDTQVDLNYRCGSPNVLRTEDVSDVSYGRILNDASAAQVTIAVSGDCCEAIGDVRTWCHEVAIYRCSTLQWSGPITKLTYTPSALIVDATDIVGWLDALPLLVGVDLTGLVDVTEIARQLIVANLDANGAGCMIMDVRPSGITLEDYFLDGLNDLGTTETVGAALRDLSSQFGLNFTAIGRRLVLFGGATPLSHLGTLTDEDFIGELAVVEDGADATTMAVVTGGFDPQIASVEGVCGVVGRVVHLDSPDAEEEDALALAQRIVAGGYPTPLRVEVGAGAALSPEAPVCLEQMVPGVNIRVLSNETCRVAAADLRLTALAVQVGANSEAVQVTLENPTLVSVA